MRAFDAGALLAAGRFANTAFALLSNCRVSFSRMIGVSQITVTSRFVGAAESALDESRKNTVKRFNR